jgi:ferredoxin-NADP reductase
MVRVVWPAAVSATTPPLPDPDGSAAALRRPGATNATLTRRIDLTPSVARFRVRPDDGVPAFAPGQYFALGLPATGGLLQRPYSAASPAGTSGDLEFLIRRVAGGALTPRLWELAEGARLRVGRPKGLFTLRPGDRRSHLFVATGTGLAPVVSMLAALLDDRGARPPSRMVIVHGVSRAPELAFGEWLSGCARLDPRLLYVPVVSRPGHPDNAGWTGAVGHVDEVLDAVCDRHGLDPRATVAYVCGNPDAVAAVNRTLLSRGFPADALVSEQYWAPVPAASATAPPPG